MACENFVFSPSFKLNTVHNFNRDKCCYEPKQNKTFTLSKPWSILKMSKLSLFHYQIFKLQSVLNTRSVMRPSERKRKKTKPSIWILAFWLTNKKKKKEDFLGV